MSAPVMTLSAGNIRASASLAAAGTANHDVDYTTKIEGQVAVKSTPGGSVAVTNGLRVVIYPRFGTSGAPETATEAAFDFTIPSVASTLASRVRFIGTGRWRITITNLDASNAITVEIGDNTVNEIT